MLTAQETKRIKQTLLTLATGVIAKRDGTFRVFVRRDVIMKNIGGASISKMLRALLDEIDYSMNVKETWSITDRGFETNGSYYLITVEAKTALPVREPVAAHPVEALPWEKKLDSYCVQGQTGDPYHHWLRLGVCSIKISQHGKDYVTKITTAEGNYHLPAKESLLQAKLDAVTHVKTLLNKAQLILS